jgi:hypothetical protein
LRSPSTSRSRPRRPQQSAHAIQNDNAFETFYYA